MADPPIHCVANTHWLAATWSLPYPSAFSYAVVEQAHRHQNRHSRPVLLRDGKI